MKIVSINQNNLNYTDYQINLGIYLSDVDAQTYRQLPLHFQNIILKSKIIFQGQIDTGMNEKLLLLARHVSLVFTARQIESGLFIQTFIKTPSPSTLQRMCTTNQQSITQVNDSVKHETHFGN